jgi:aryl-alcohol dehydrogenase-like predicted oxidoreductase
VVNQAERVVLGTAQWGAPYGIANRTGVPDRSEVARMLSRARLSGITTLDTARAYGDSESVIGTLVGGDPAWSIVTKVPPLDLSDASEGAASDRARRAIDESLAALRRSRLDVVLLHDPGDRTRSRGGAWSALRALQRDGAIGALGISARSPAEAFAALEAEGVDVVQVATSLLDSRLVRADFVRTAEVANRRLFLRSAFLQGVAHLRPQDLPSHLSAARPVLAAIARWGHGREMTTADACLLYLRDVCTCPIVLGMESDSQLEANLRAWARPPLGRGAIAELEALVPELPDAVVDPSKWPRPARR